MPLPGSTCRATWGLGTKSPNIPNWFQKKCVSDTSADYSLQPDGSVKVFNRCKMADGTWAEAIGQAVQTGPLRVTT